MEILVLEASTTSAKAMLYHTEDRSFEVKVRAYTGNYEDVTIHNAENVYLDMVSVGRELLDGRQVDMIALGGTWHSLVLCDGAVKPVTPVYPWSYTGAAPVCKRLRHDAEYVSRYYQKTGCMVNAIYPFFKLMMLREQGYEIVGLTMWVWGDEPSEARQLAQSMGIEHYVADERKAFRR